MLHRTDASRQTVDIGHSRRFGRCRLCTL